MVYAYIELINTTDVELARRQIISEEEIKRLRLPMLADSGAYMMAVNETIQSQPEFPFIEKRKAVMGRWYHKRI